MWVDLKNVMLSAAGHGGPCIVGFYIWERSERANLQTRTLGARVEVGGGCRWAGGSLWGDGNVLKWDCSGDGAIL